MAYFLFADERHDSLLPFTYTRNAFDLRCGIFTFAERWREALGGAPAILPHLHLKELYPAASYAGTHIWINGLTIPTPEMLRLLTEIPPGTYAHGTDGLVYAAHMALDSLPAAREGLLTREWFAASGLKAMQVELPPMPTVTQLPDLFRLNAEMIRFDFPFATAKASSEKITDPHTRLYGADNIYVAPGVQVKAAIIDAENGPVYLGPNVQIQPGAVIQHTHAFGPNSVVNVGAKLRGDSSFGPYVKVGGEIGNSVIMGYSNKGHEGYLGNSVLGYWCNLGADTNTSNLKNNYAPVKLWHYPSGRFKDTGLTFCGLMMGDHSKAGINTMFNTGTVVGVSANIFGAGYPRNFVPSFTWGGPAGMTTYRTNKALEVAERVMARRKVVLTEADRWLMEGIFARTAEYRRWE